MSRDDERLYDPALIGLRPAHAWVYANSQQRRSQSRNPPFGAHDVLLAEFEVETRVSQPKYQPHGTCRWRPAQWGQHIQCSCPDGKEFRIAAEIKPAFTTASRSFNPKPEAPAFQAITTLADAHAAGDCTQNVVLVRLCRVSPYCVPASLFLSLLWLAVKRRVYLRTDPWHFLLAIESESEA